MAKKDLVKPSLYKKFKVFWRNNWVMICIILSVLFLILWAIYGLMSMESFL